MVAEVSSTLMQPNLVQASDVPRSVRHNPADQAWLRASLSFRSSEVLFSIQRVQKISCEVHPTEEKILVGLQSLDPVLSRRCEQGWSIPGGWVAASSAKMLIFNVQECHAMHPMKKSSCPLPAILISDVFLSSASAQQVASYVPVMPSCLLPSARCQEPSCQVACCQAACCQVVRCQVPVPSVPRLGC